MGKLIGNSGRIFPSAFLLLVPQSLPSLRQRPMTEEPFVSRVPARECRSKQRLVYFPPGTSLMGPLSHVSCGEAGRFAPRVALI